MYYVNDIYELVSSNEKLKHFTFMKTEEEVVGMIPMNNIEDGSSSVITYIITPSKEKLFVVIEYINTKDGKEIVSKRWDIAVDSKELMTILEQFDKLPD